MFRLSLQPLKGLRPVRLMTKNVISRHWSQQIRLQSTQPATKKPGGISALVKEYGFSALGIYLGLSAIDLPFFYILVHSAGREKIEYYENQVKQVFGFGVSDEELKKRQEINKIDSDVENSENNHVSNENQSTLSYILSQLSLTEFVLAYGIHKSFIFIRLPIAASITPPVVKTLRRWGFKLGTQKLSSNASIAKNNIKDYTASNPKFGVRPDKKKKWFNGLF